MILIDRRNGSEDLYLPLVNLGVECKLTTLSFGDLAFAGHGPHGSLVAVGIERKRIRDLVNSLMSGRLQGFQLPGCVKYFDHAWLLVEGRWRVHDRSGLVEITGRDGWHPIVPRIMGASLAGWLLTVQLRGGFRLVVTDSQEETARWTQQLYHWWTAKEWEQHRGHLALYQPPDTAIFKVPTLVQRVAALLPGIGEEKSSTVDRHFGTVLEMACAARQSWEVIPGIGPGIASRAVEALQGDLTLKAAASTPTSRRSVSSSSQTGTYSTPSKEKRSKKRSG